MPRVYERKKGVGQEDLEFIWPEYFCFSFSPQTPPFVLILMFRVVTVLTHQANLLSIIGPLLPLQTSVERVHCMKQCVPNCELYKKNCSDQG